MGRQLKGLRHVLYIGAPGSIPGTTWFPQIPQEKHPNNEPGIIPRVPADVAPKLKNKLKTKGISTNTILQGRRDCMATPKINLTSDVVVLCTDLTNSLVA